MIRRSYPCDCNGDATPGRETPRMTDGTLSVIEDVTGHRPPSCPWSAFSDPLVRDVLHAYRFFESGQLSIGIGDDPPARLVEGIALYHTSVQHLQADDIQRRREENKRKGGG